MADRDVPPLLPVSSVYREDLVQLVSQPDLRGLVMHVAGASDSDADTDYSDDEEDVRLTPLGFARICWLNSEGQHPKDVRMDDVRVLDRAFMHGDRVALASDPLGQLGTVADVDLRVDLEGVKGDILRDVDSKKLRRIRPFASGGFVVQDFWVGRVEFVEDNVTVLFDDGSKSKILRADPELVQPATVDPMHDDDYPFYPGQRVKAVTPGLLRQHRWMRGKSKKSLGVVVDVEASTVSVDWVGAGNAPSTASRPPPGPQQNPKSLLPLTYFSYTEWQIGDRTLPPVDESSLLENEFSDEQVDDSEDHPQPSGSGVGKTSAEGAPPEVRSCRKSKQRRVKLDPKIKLPKRDEPSDSGSREEVYEYALRVVNTKTTVDVIWQDGTRSCGLDTCSLVPKDNFGDHEFFPEEYVIERGSDGEGVEIDSRRVGVVQSVDSRERTAKVRWLKSSCLRKSVVPLGEAREWDNEEVVSCYELFEHPEYSYSLGDVVVRLAPDSSDQGASGYHGVGTKRGKPWQAPADLRGLSWVGSIIGLQGGDIQVAWLNGSVSMVEPRDVITLSRGEDGSSTYDNESEGYDGEGVDDDTSSWETAKSSDVAVLADFKEFEPHQTAEEIPDLFGILTFLDAPEVFQDEGEQESMSLREQERGSEGEHESDLPRDNEVGLEISGVKKDGFRHFDSVTGASDHNYFSELGQLSNQKKWLKRVQQEWALLEKNLPDTIFVRVYEDRMDLLRAVIVGVSGTPYHGGLFVFDIFLPPDFPTLPPVAYYHSGGLRLNPNLYENGKVCLSLLNTWTGTETEVWNPRTSSILQVLLSIQALVLNEKPYFNEAGYDRQVGTAEGEKNSLIYNENAFLLCCKTMLYQLRRPPQHFEKLVKEHYKSQGPHIIEACNAYLAGARVGSLPAIRSNGDVTEESSAGFKLMLAKILPKLQQAFSQVDGL